MKRRRQAWNRGRKRPLIIEQKDRDRFWGRVVRRGLDDCWLWTASLTGSGYGQMYWFGRPRTASRIAWWLAFGDPGPLDVLHKCDTPKCCNPQHLFLGTQVDNLVDMWAKQRGQHGNTHYAAKLSYEKAKEIRDLFQGGMRLYKLAANYGVDRMTIKAVITGRTWKRPHYP